MNRAAISICYADHDAKRRTWLQHILPQLFATARAAMRPDMGQLEVLAEWLAGAGLDLQPRNGIANDLARLHELARNGEYVASTLPCDVVAWPADTIINGGKCSDWLVVLGAVLNAWGVPWRIATAGDALDPFRHVWVQAASPSGVWRDLDPKGNAYGLDFGERVRGPEIVQFWEAR
jgi:hypothetical protein